MNILTKVFVVMVTVLSIGLVAMVVTFAANTENFREQLDQEVANRKAAESSAQLLQNEIKTLNIASDQRIATLTSENQNLSNQVGQLSSQIDSLNGRINEKDQSIGELQADIDRINETKRQMSLLLNQQNEELVQRRDEVVGLKTQIIQQADRINELDSQREQLGRQVRRMEEQLHDSGEQLTELNEKIAQMPAAIRVQYFGDEGQLPPYRPNIYIEGRVTDVRQEAGQTFVSINLGTTDRVRQRMEFTIARGEQFVGNLVVSLVDEGAASGTIKTPRMAVQVGDRVFTGPTVGG